MVAAMPTAEDRRERLKEVWRESQGCTRCPQLAATRRTVVFGAGNADADLMFVGEAPGANEDAQGLPFVGQAGRLLETLLEEIGLARADVFIANVLKCRPPGNRDPLPQEIDACQDYLHRQLELIAPTRGLHAGQLLDQAAAGGPDGDHAAARAGGGAPARSAGRAAVPALPPGGGALHPVDAGDPPHGLPPHPGAAGPRGARAARARARARAGPEPEPVIPVPELVEEPELVAAAEPEPSQLGLF